MKIVHRLICTLTLGLPWGGFQLRCLAVPDREQFIRECLDAAATPDTPQFDDYHKGSYQADKLDLLYGLNKASESGQARLRAIIMVGPSGLLWSYRILIVLSEGDHIRLNYLAMPHARITNKATRR